MTKSKILGQISKSYFVTPPQKILCKNNAVSCKIFTCFQMHLVNGGHPFSLNPPLGLGKVKVLR